MNPPLKIPVACIAHATAAIRKARGAPEGDQRCQGFECTSVKAMRRRQNTAYADDTRNWCTLCPECQKMADEEWAERWDEYYAGCM